MAPATKYGGKMVVAHREVEGDDRVHGEHQRRRQRREQQVGHFIAVPVAIAAAPSEGEETVPKLPDGALGPISQRREVGNEADIPEHQ